MHCKLEPDRRRIRDVDIHVTGAGNRNALPSRRRRRGRSFLGRAGVCNHHVFLLLPLWVALVATDTHVKWAGAMPCDFDGSTQCDVLDLDLMYGQGNLVSSVAVGGGNVFDLNSDLAIDNLDLTIWLADAATANGYASPYLRGDTDDLSGPGLRRDVDITDFNQFAANFDPSGINVATNTWGNANFDGDNDVDVTDFNYLASNFAPGGYGTIPEPTTVRLVILGLASVLLLLPQCRRLATFD